MNIYALAGHKVKVTEETKSNGYDHHVEQVAKYLEVGKIYTVESTDVSSWSTVVYLQEIPKVGFNSTCFEDVEPQSEEDDQEHPDWRRWN